MLFVIAGFLCHRQNLKIYIKKKINRILIPFITFSMLKIIYIFFVSNQFSHSENIGVQLYDAFICGGLYWFPYALLFMYFLAPFIWKDERNKAFNNKTLILLIIVFAFNTLRDVFTFDLPRVFQFSQMMDNLHFFLIGMIIAENKSRVILLFNKYEIFIKIGGVLILAAFVFTDIIEYPIIMLSLQILVALSLMYFFYKFAKILKPNNYILKTIGKYSYQIMFLDSFFRVVLYKLASYLPYENIMVLNLVMILNVFFSCVVCIILEKIPIIKKAIGL